MGPKRIVSHSKFIMAFANVLPGDICRLGIQTVFLYVLYTIHL
jgi:hypothetical protein